MAGRKRRGWGEGSISGERGPLVRAGIERRAARPSQRPRHRGGCQAGAEGACRSNSTPGSTRPGARSSSSSADWLDGRGANRRGERLYPNIMHHRWAAGRVIENIGTTCSSRQAHDRPRRVDARRPWPPKGRGAERPCGRLRLVLVRALEDAVARDYVVQSRARYARLPRSTNGGRPSKAMTAEQLGDFLVVIDGTEDEAIWLTMVGCGLRPGEVCGLRWTDLELDADPPLLHVRQARLHHPDGIGHVRSAEDEGRA